MRTSIRIAALLVSSALFVGCDSKSNTTTTPPPTTPPTTPTMTPPAMPDTSKTTSAINGAIDKGADVVKTDANKLLSSVPTTKPAMPDMPAMPK